MGFGVNKTATRRSGELVQWNNKGGFGFVRDDAGHDYYVHVSKLTSGQRPRIGDILEFGVTSGRNGRPAAVDVTIAQTSPAPAPVLRPALQARAPGVSRWTVGLRTAAATMITLLILLAISTDHAPFWLAPLYAGMGLASALLYRFDKLYAITNRWRVSEFNLHVIDLCFGIIGGLSAQEIYRHKTIKPPFVAMTWTIALIHILGLTALAFGWFKVLYTI